MPSGDEGAYDRNDTVALFVRGNARVPVRVGLPADIDAIDAEFDHLRGARARDRRPRSVPNRETNRASR